MPEGSAGLGPGLQIFRSADRFTTEADGIVTRHCFSFGSHYEPANVGFGALRAVNDEWLAPGAGYDAHHHADTEIVTWVFEGALRHEDSTGNGGIIRPGQVQRLSAGSGVEHGERNASETEPVHFIQMWLAPDFDAAAEPAYAQVDLDLTPGKLVHTLSIRNRGARLSAVRLDEGQQVTIPPADLVHLHVVRGSVDVAGHTLGAGDTARLVDAQRIQALGVEQAEILVWQMSKAGR